MLVVATLICAALTKLKCQNGIYEVAVTTYMPFIFFDGKAVLKPCVILMDDVYYLLTTAASAWRFPIHYLILRTLSFCPIQRSAAGGEKTDPVGRTLSICPIQRTAAGGEKTDPMGRR